MAATKAILEVVLAVIEVIVVMVNAAMAVVSLELRIVCVTLSGISGSRLTENAFYPETHECRASTGLPHFCPGGDGSAVGCSRCCCWAGEMYKT